MDNNFEENNKFFSLNGTINRRNFIANYLIIEIFEALFYVTPLLIYMMFNPDIMSITIKKSMSGSYPFPGMLLVTGLIETGLLYPSIVKRIRDITGKYDTNWILIIIPLFMIAYIPAAPAAKHLFSTISLFIIICLMCIKGKISGERPKSELFKFNWGAMLGTWIWGLFNKSYITLFAIPIFFTTGFIPFMILCGIKGNEWAYKNSKKSIEDFHKSQSTQTTIFAIIIPIIFIIGSLTALITGSVALGTYLKKHPEALQKLDSYSAKMIKTTTEAKFSKIEFTEDEYKFYFDPAEWKAMPKSAKLNSFRVIESYAVLHVYGGFKTSEINRIKTFNKIKIYSTFNNELLADFYFDESKYKELIDKLNKSEITAGEFLKELNQKYRINENPTLP